MMTEAFEKALYYAMELASFYLIKVVQKIGYMSPEYTSEDLEKLYKALREESSRITAEMSGNFNTTSMSKSQFEKGREKFEIYFVSPEYARRNLWRLAGIEMKHINRNLAQDTLEGIQNKSNSLQ